MSRESDDNLSSINSAYTDLYQETVKRFTRSSLSPEVDRFASSPSRMSTKSTSQKSDRDRSLSFDLYLEATGRRRSSDHGAVLTSDTEQFIIGQRVWVGGARPGQIAYIGETHFAPGDWAGIVLDEPNGKNDGCVSGKRYFQCEPRRGIFSRLTRLTLAPLPGAIPPSSPLSKYTPDRSRTVSPTASIHSSVFRSPGKNGLTVGDRIIVSSGFGSRPGILRYLGETQFASGNWCGVELDEATGKNDGSVDGIKYFDCPPKCGVFVPIAKVSLSPSSKKIRLSRTGSRESLTSIGTMNSVVTTNTSRLRMSAQQRKPSSLKPASSSTPKSQFSMQDLLREKHNHIEQLMIERDLDREDAHNQALQFQKNISELKSRISDLERKLGDERKKTEDLQFSIDEATFCGDELNAQTQVYKEKIHDLEHKITQLASGTSSLQTPSIQENSAAIAAATEAANAKIAELSAKLRKETGAHEQQIAELTAKFCEATSVHEQQVIGIQDEEKRLLDNVKYLQAQNETLQKELLEKDESLEKFSLSESGIENLRRELALIKDENDRERKKMSVEYATKLEEKSTQLHKISEELASLKNTIATLESERNNVEDECEILRAECKTRDKQLQELSAQVAKLTAELSVQMAESATLDELLKEQQLGGVESKTSLQDRNVEIEKLKEQINELQHGKTKLEAELQKSLEELQKLDKMHREFEDRLKNATCADEEKAVAMKKLETVMEELKQQMITTESKNIEITAELNAMAELNNAKQVAEEQLQKQLQEKTQALEANCAELKEAKEAMLAVQQQISSLNKETQEALTNKDAHIESLNIEIRNLQEKTKALAGESSTTVQQMSKRINELEAQIKELQDRLRTSEEQLEKQRQVNVKHESTIADKLAELSNTLNALESTEKLLNQFRHEQESLHGKYGVQEEQLKKSEEKSTQQELEVGDLKRRYEALNTKCETFATQNESLQHNLMAARTSGSDTQTIVTKLNEEIASKQKAFEELQLTCNTERLKIENQTEELKQKLANGNKDYEELKANLLKTREELNKRNKYITGLEEKNVKQELSVSDAARQQNNLQTKYDALAEQNAALQNDLLSLRTTSTDSNVELLKLAQDVAAKQKAYEELLDKSSTERAALESQLQASQQRVDALCSQVEALTQELKSTTEESFKHFEQLKEAADKCGKQDLELSDSVRKLEALATKSEGLEVQNKVLEQELTALRTASTDKNSDVLKLTQEIAKMQKAQQELSDKSNAERLELQSQLQELSLRAESTQGELKNVRQELELSATAKTKQENEFESFKVEFNTNAQQALETAQANNTAERKALCESFEQQLKAAEKTKINLDEAISSLQLQIRLLQDELLKSQLDFKSKEEELLKQIKAFVNEKDQLCTTLQKVQVEGSSTLTSVQQEKAELLQSIQKLSEQLKLQEAAVLAATTEAQQQKLMQANVSAEMTKLEAQRQALETSLEFATEEQKHQTTIAAEQKNKIEELKVMLEAVQTMNANMSATNAELSQALQQLESEKCETAHNFELFEMEADQYEAKLKEMQAKLEQQNAETQQMLQTKDSTLAESQVCLQKLSAELQASQNALEGVQTNALADAAKHTELAEANTELTKVLADKEALIQQLIVKLSTNDVSLSKQTQELNGLRQHIEKLQNLLPTAEEIRAREENDFQLAEYKKIVDEMDDVATDKTSKLAELQQSSQQLKQERHTAVEAEKARNTECASLQRQLERLDLEKTREVVTLQARLNDLQALNKLKQNGSAGAGSALDDGEDSTAQINFLNSIIADMQKKNDTLKAKIEALEALPTDFTKPDAFEMIAKRKPAPRVFCDICDEFDKHETEDCPLQASDDREYSPPLGSTSNNNNDNSKNKERILPEPRKYCESCEVFGHETGECDDECY